MFSIKLTDWISDYLPKDEPVLDIGCGRGTRLYYLLKGGFEDVTGIDPKGGKEFEEIVKHEAFEPFDLGRQYNIISVGVAEDMPPGLHPGYLDNILRHSRSRVIVSFPSDSIKDLFINNGYVFNRERSFEARQFTEEIIHVFEKVS